MNRLTYTYLENPIEFDENYVNMLVIENPKKYLEFIKEIKKLEKEKSDIIFYSKDYEEATFSKYVCPIYFALDIEFDNKKIMSKICQDIENIAFEDMYTKTSEMLSYIENYVEELLEKVDIELEYEQIDLKILEKAINLKVKKEDKNLLSTICDYINLVSEVLKIDEFIFFNIKTMLLKEEIEQLYEYAIYKKIKLLICENTKRQTLKYEKLIILDDDMCQI